jgi:hypothetical protein
MPILTKADSPYETRYADRGRDMDEVLNRYQNTLNQCTSSS